jgi:hypothetical protein
MDDDRIVSGPAFDFVNLGDRPGFQRIGRETVNCFGRYRDHFTRPQQCRRLFHRCRKPRCRVR